MHSILAMKTRTLNCVLCFVLICMHRCEGKIESTYFGIGDICLTQIYPYTTLEGIDKIIKICLRIQEYYDCIIERRRGLYLDVDENIMPFFQKKFPDEYDLRRGGYVFCLEMLPQVIRSYALDDRRVKSCEVSLQRHLCFDVKNKNDHDLNSHTIKELSCNYSIKYFTCLREQFESCTTNDFPLFYLQLAELGPACLLRHRRFIPMILWKACWYIFQSKGQGHSEFPSMSGTFTVAAISLLVTQTAASF